MNKEIKEFLDIYMVKCANNYRNNPITALMREFRLGKHIARMYVMEWKGELA